VTQEVSLAELVEDAIRINLASIERHGIRVVRDLEDLPIVILDKQKLLQILVNLISNAKYALIDSDSDDKRLIVRLRRSGPDRVRLDVEDNGVGIAPENLPRIFSWGFTTRKDGHGFGLHSAASSVQEMDGALSAYSEGLGTGSAFCLDLPIEFVGARACTVNAN
jgi:C4-dicarboxylate-specific signal transduction histidine kinase